MKRITSLTLDEDVEEFLKIGFNKSAKANHILKESKEYRDHVKQKLGY